MNRLYDPMCYDLACHFMKDKKFTKEDKQELAIAIQTLCEDLTTLDSEES